MFISIDMKFRQFMNIVVSITSLSLCMLVFALITRVNIIPERFIFVILVMATANAAISNYVGMSEKDTTLNSFISFLYMSHFMFRACVAVEGGRLDVNKSDAIYLGLINFMEIPYFLLGILNFMVPIARWASLNLEYEISEEDAIATEVSGQDKKKNKAEKSKKQK